MFAADFLIRSEDSVALSFIATGPRSQLPAIWRRRPRQAVADVSAGFASKLSARSVSVMIIPYSILAAPGHPPLHPLLPGISPLHE